jgi:hypothetical protein
MNDDWKQVAENIYNDYTKKKIINSAYQDAVIAFLWLIVRLMIASYDRQTPSVVPAKDSKKK